MGKQQTEPVLNRLKGRTVVFQGKFGYGEADQLRAMAEAQGATIGEALDKSTDYLVLPDLSGGKTAQKKAQSLIAKGATIQVLDAGDFRKLVEPMPDEIVAMIRKGAAFAETFNKALNRIAYGSGSGQGVTITAENFDDVDLSGFNFYQVQFNGCSFRQATLSRTNFSVTDNCDFTGAGGGERVDVGQSRHSIFRDARFPGAVLTRSLEGGDFTGADLRGTNFHNYGAWSSAGRVSSAQGGLIFRKANLSGARFNTMNLEGPDFEGADLSKATFTGCKTRDAVFRKAILREADLLGSRFPGADFSGADLRGATLINADLTDAKFDGADLTGANLRDAKVGGVDFSRARGYDPSRAGPPTIGPAMKELDGVCKAAKRVQITFFLVRNRDDETGGEGEAAGIDTSGFPYGWGLQLPHDHPGSGSRGLSNGAKMSEALQRMADLMPNRKLRYETVEVQSTKSPTGGKELRELVLKALAEAFDQPLPKEEDLAAATKAYRDKQREAGAAERERREREKKAAEKEKAKEQKQREKKIEKEVGKVTDIATFLKALELRADPQKIKKATKMLKAEKFQLFNDVTETYMSGVVKSQTDPDLVYACRIESDGHYACCTQNLNVCGGLRGSPCKHLLVLIIGLVKAEKLDPTTIDGWVAKTHEVKPELDKEVMGEIFIRYKGAEAGEVDWRPTETVPEDYYAL